MVKTYDYNNKFIEYCRNFHRSNHLKQHYAISLTDSFKIQKLYENVSRGRGKFIDGKIKFDIVSDEEVKRKLETDTKIETKIKNQLISLLSLRLDNILQSGTNHLNIYNIAEIDEKIRKLANFFKTFDLQMEILGLAGINDLSVKPGMGVIVIPYNSKFWSKFETHDEQCNTSEEATIQATTGQSKIKSFVSHHSRNSMGRTTSFKKMKKPGVITSKYKPSTKTPLKKTKLSSKKKNTHIPSSSTTKTDKSGNSMGIGAVVATGLGALGLGHVLIRKGNIRKKKSRCKNILRRLKF